MGTTRITLASDLPWSALSACASAVEKSLASPLSTGSSANDLSASVSTSNACTIWTIASRSVGGALMMIAFAAGSAAMCAPAPA